MGYTHLNQTGTLKNETNVPVEVKKKLQFFKKPLEAVSVFRDSNGFGLYW